MGALLCPVMEAERNRKRKASSSFLARILPVKCYGAGTSLVVQWLSLHLLMQRVQVRSPVGELGSPTPCLMAQNPKHKQKPSRNEFNKHFENGPHQENLFKTQSVEKNLLRRLYHKVKFQDKADLSSNLCSQIILPHTI